MAEKITVNVPHKHTKLEVRDRIDQGFGKVEEQIGSKGITVEQAWTGDRMDFVARAMGQKVTGNLLVEEGQICIEVDLPWMLKAFAPKVQEKLRSGAQLMLEKK